MSRVTRAPCCAMAPKSTSNGTRWSGSPGTSCTSDRRSRSARRCCRRAVVADLGPGTGAARGAAHAVGVGAVDAAVFVVVEVVVADLLPGGAQRGSPKHPGSAQSARLLQSSSRPLLLQISRAMHWLPSGPPSRPTMPPRPPPPPMPPRPATLPPMPPRPAAPPMPPRPADPPAPPRPAAPPAPPRPPGAAALPPRPAMAPVPPRPPASGPPSPHVEPPLTDRCRRRRANPPSGFTPIPPPPPRRALNRSLRPHAPLPTTSVININMRGSCRMRRSLHQAKRSR